MAIQVLVSDSELQGLIAANPNQVFTWHQSDVDVCFDRSIVFSRPEKIQVAGLGGLVVLRIKLQKSLEISQPQETPQDATKNTHRGQIWDLWPKATPRCHTWTCLPCNQRFFQVNLIQLTMVIIRQFHHSCISTTNAVSGSEHGTGHANSWTPARGGWRVQGEVWELHSLIKSIISKSVVKPSSKSADLEYPRA